MGSTLMHGLKTEVGGWTKKGYCVVKSYPKGEEFMGDRTVMGRVYRFPNPKAKRYSERYEFYIELDGEKLNFAERYSSKSAAADKLVWFWNLRNQGKETARKTS